jgi:hypothetical protein
MWQIALKNSKIAGLPKFRNVAGSQFQPLGVTCSGGNFLVSWVVRRSWPHAKQAQEGLEMKKTFGAFVAVATIAGSLAATPASAQRGVAAGVAAPGRYYEPAPYGAGRGPYDYFGSCEWVQQRFYDGHGWRVRRVRVCG